MIEILQVGFNGLSYGCTLALVSLGLTLVFGILRIVNFAHGAMYMLGAYAAYYLVELAGLPYSAAVVGAGIAIAALGAFLAVAIFQRFREKMLEGAIVAIALTLLITNMAFALFSGVPKQLIGSLDDVVLDFGGVRMIGQRLLIIVVAALLLGCLTLVIRNSKWGRALRAVQQDPYVARLQGIDVDRVSIQTLALGGGLAGIAGALVAPDQVILPSMGEGPLLLAFVVIILGGMGSILGSLVASLGVGLTISTISTYWTPTAATWICFLLVLFFLVVRPRGLFGHE